MLLKERQFPGMRRAWLSIPLTTTSVAALMRGQLVVPSTTLPICRPMRACPTSS
jgi:hypothetical protein